MVVLSAKSCFICIAWSRTIPGCIVLFSHYLSLICMSYSYRIPLYKYNSMHVSTFWSSYFGMAVALFTRRNYKHQDIHQSMSPAIPLFAVLKVLAIRSQIQHRIYSRIIIPSKTRFFTRSVPNRAVILLSKVSPPPTVPHRCSTVHTDDGISIRPAENGLGRFIRPIDDEMGQGLAEPRKTCEERVDG
jgi:hypothetical protein